MGVFNLDSEEFKPPKEVTQSLAQVTCPGYKVEQSQELLKASGPNAGEAEKKNERNCSNNEFPQNRQLSHPYMTTGKTITI